MEVGVKENVKKKFKRSMWAGHVGKMGDEKLAKRVDALKVERKWRRGRPNLRSMGGCIKNDLERVGERGRDDR